MATVDLLTQARQAQLSGDTATAEKDYRQILAETDPKASDDADTIVAKASWNLAILLRDQHGAFAEAADILDRSRRNRAGVLRNDPELHTLYAQLRIQEFETRAKSFDLGPAQPVFVGANNAIDYTPAPLEALRQGARAYMTALRQSGDDPKFADFAKEAKTGIAYGADAYKAYAGSVQMASVGRIMAAMRDRMLAKGKLKPDDPRATMKLMTEGGLVDAMTAKTTALRQAAKAAMMDDGDYSGRWQAWSLTQIGAANALTTTPEQ